MLAQRFKNSLTSLTLLACVAIAPAAFAHAHLHSQTPAADSSVAAVKALRLSFTEGVEEKFSRVTLTADGGRQLPLSSIATAVDDKKILIVTPVAPLAAGHYTVEWHVVSTDTHNSDGSYVFTVSP